MDLKELKNPHLKLKPPIDLKPLRNLSLNYPLELSSKLKNDPSQFTQSTKSKIKLSSESPIKSPVKLENIKPRRINLVSKYVLFDLIF
jgi:hypothetical protein